MNVKPTRIPGVFLLTTQVFGDSRGVFYEAWNARTFADAGLHATWVQDNVAESTKGVLRGLHCQVRQTQTKLVRCLHGEVFDVAVDVRANSPTFGQWVGVQLSASEHQALWIPAGFAHGYYVMSESATVQYKTSDFYAPAHERILRWDDPEVAIAWPGSAPILSERDRNGASLDEARTWFSSDGRWRMADGR